jgi:hypothetical protein
MEGEVGIDTILYENGVRPERAFLESIASPLGTFGARARPRYRRLADAPRRRTENLAPGAGVMCRTGRAHERHGEARSPMDYFMQAAHEARMFIQRSRALSAADIASSKGAQVLCRPFDMGAAHSRGALLLG